MYKVIFGKPLDYEVVVEFDLLSLSHRNSEAIDLLGLLAKEGWQKAHIGEYHSYKQALNKYALGAILLSEPALRVLRRQLRLTAPGLKVELEELKRVLEADVLKREVLEGDKAASAKKQVTRAARRAQREKESEKNEQESPSNEESSAGTVFDVEQPATA